MKKPRSLKQMIMSALGKVWMVWHGRNEAKRRCKIQDKNNAHNGWFVCEKCGSHREKIEIDHIEPIVKPEEGFVDWNTYIASKFVEADKLQSLCHECHKEKSSQENKLRRENKRRTK